MGSGKTLPEFKESVVPDGSGVKTDLASFM